MTRRPAQVAFFQRFKAPLEVRTHIAIADLLRVAAASGWWWSHIGHGGKRSKATGGLLERMGLRPGISDFLLISPTGQHHWMELKRGHAPLNENQIIFFADMHARNVSVEVVRSFDEAVAHLNKLGALKPAPLGDWRSMRAAA
jgi:hypothetical protein